MSLSQSLFNEHENFITPSEIIEFMYCKRFTYFMNCLGIDQHEDERYKVMKGRNIHDQKSKENVEYIRKRINGKAKYSNIYMISRKLSLKGIVDEVYELEDGTLAPLDYKYAVYNDKDFVTYKTQMTLYSLLIEDVYGVKVDKMYLVYCRSGNLIKEISFDDNMRKNALKAVEEYKKVLGGYYPKATAHKSKCLDCCYKNVCEG